MMAMSLEKKNEILSDDLMKWSVILPVPLYGGKEPNLDAP